MILDDLRGSHMFSDLFIIFSVLSGSSPKKKHLKSPCVLQIWFRIFVAISWVHKGLLYYLRWTCLFARRIWITYKRAHMTYHQNSSNQPDGPMVSTYLDLWYLRHDDIFHDPDKGPKHVEMFRTKCQPKIGTDKMPTTEKSPDEMPTTEKSLDKMPTFGWHYVRLAFCPVGILSYHLVSSTLCHSVANRCS